MDAYLNHDFMVVEGLTKDAIGFPRDQQVCAKGNIVITDPSVSLISNPFSLYNGHCNVRVLQKYIILPHCELEIVAHLDS